MTERALTPVSRLLSACLHLLVLALLVLTTVRAYLGAADHPGGVLAAAVVLGAVYLAGPLLPGVRRSAAGAGLWLAVLLVEIGRASWRERGWRAEVTGAA